MHIVNSQSARSKSRIVVKEVMWGTCMYRCASISIYIYVFFATLDPIDYECETSFKKPTVTKIKHWFTTQWDYIYNKYKVGDNPNESEGNLTNKTIGNEGDKPRYTYICRRQDDPGGPSKTIIPTYTRGEWYGKNTNKIVTVSNLVRVQEYVTYNTLKPLKNKSTNREMIELVEDGKNKYTKR